MEDELSGLQEVGDMVEEAVREAEEDMEALTILLQHSQVEEAELRGKLSRAIRQGEEELSGRVR